tara:strand:+ start:49 stop:468 length:420 start_codon:yes stop_codon:yes gene_type:complete
MASTGNTATLSVGSSVARVRSISGVAQSADTVETSHLGTTNFKTLMAGDLTDPGTFTADIIYSGSSWTVANQGDAAVTITIVFPAVYGGSSTSLSGTGFVTGQTFPEAQNGELMVQQITVQFDGGDDSSGTGGTEPTFA